MGEVASEVAASLDAAVEGLQFEDVSGQLLGLVQRRTQALDLLLAKLAALGAGGDEAAARELEDALDQARELTAGGTLAQKGMGDGDVDLS
jgi:hypothetical protein